MFIFMKPIKKLKSRFVYFYKNNEIRLSDEHKDYQPPIYGIKDEFEDAVIKIYPEFIEITGYRVITESVIKEDNFCYNIYKGHYDKEINIIMNQYKIVQ